jgi:hypothetical protein
MIAHSMSSDTAWGGDASEAQAEVIRPGLNCGEPSHDALGEAPKHISWLHDTGERLPTACGREIEIWALDHKQDEAVLSAWAKHFRQNYISDQDLPAMVDGLGISRAEYLRTILFPDASETPGPSLRSGDFGEILVADYIEHLLGYWCPHTLRYQDRWNRNDSTKGCDIIGFKFVSDEPHHREDELFISETKSGMTKTNANRSPGDLEQLVAAVYRAMALVAGVK